MSDETGRVKAFHRGSEKIVRGEDLLELGAALSREPDGEFDLIAAGLRFARAEVRGGAVTITLIPPDHHEIVGIPKGRRRRGRLGTKAGADWWP